MDVFGTLTPATLPLREGNRMLAEGVGDILLGFSLAPFSPLREGLGMRANPQSFFATRISVSEKASAR